MTRSLTLSILALTLVLLGPPSEARACNYGGCGGLIVGAAVGGAVVGLGSLGVLGMDLSHNLRGRWVGQDLAIGNLALGVADLAGGVALAVAVRNGHGLGWGLGFATAGLLMIVEGSLSLALYEEGGERPLGLSLGPGPGDAGVSLRATW